jgi:hypothetical protein
MRVEGAIKPSRSKWFAPRGVRRLAPVEPCCDLAQLGRCSISRGEPREQSALKFDACRIEDLEGKIPLTKLGRKVGHVVTER